MENKKPLTKKAVETRQKLLVATLEQIALKGFHNVTVDEIAAASNVATGTAYRYFLNKKEMLIEALKYYYENINAATDTEEEQLKKFNSLEEMLGYVLDQFYELHKKYYGIHEELESLRHIDSEVREAYNSITMDAIEKLFIRCPDSLKQLPNLKERIFLGISMLENYAHLQIDAKSKEFDMDIMKNLTLELVVQVIGYK